MASCSIGHVATKKRSSRSSRRSPARRRHGDTVGDFDFHKYVMTLQEARAYLDAAVESVRRDRTYLDGLRNSVWRLSQALVEIEKAERQLGLKGAGVESDVRALDELVKAIR
jgi:hypothetical protein